MSSEEATCGSCGRRMEPRRSDRGASAATPRKFCSAACRKRKVRPVDRALEEALLELLSTRARGASVCPSEAARSVFASSDGDDDGWRELVEPARCAARRLVAIGKVVVTQQNRIVDPSTAKGPIRVRRIDES